MAAGAQRPGQMIEGINVTPLVDVVLVLLIVLMVTASYTVSQALPMELPQASTGEQKSSPLAISLSADGLLYLDGEELSKDELRQRVKARRELEKREGGKPSALLAADGAVAHRRVVSVIDLLRECGVTKFAINVAPQDLNADQPAN